MRFAFEGAFEGKPMRPICMLNVYSNFGCVKLYNVKFLGNRTERIEIHVVISRLFGISSERMFSFGFVYCLHDYRQRNTFTIQQKLRYVGI